MNTTFKHSSGLGDSEVLSTRNSKQMHLKTQRRRFPDGKITEEKPRIEHIWHGFSNMATPATPAVAGRRGQKAMGLYNFPKLSVEARGS